MNAQKQHFKRSAIVKVYFQFYKLPRRKWIFFTINFDVRVDSSDKRSFLLSHFRGRTYPAKRCATVNDFRLPFHYGFGSALLTTTGWPHFLRCGSVNADYKYYDRESSSSFWRRWYTFFLVSSMSYLKWFFLLLPISIASIGWWIIDSCSYMEISGACRYKLTKPKDVFILHETNNVICPQIDLRNLIILPEYQRVTVQVRNFRFQSFLRLKKGTFWVSLDILEL